MAGERILVVDDDPAIVELCTRALARQGYTVQGDTDGREAVAHLRSVRWDLLVVDLKMPDVDGLTVIQQGREADPRLTAVVITAYATPDNLIEAVHAGARRFLLKPFSPQEMCSAVEDALVQRDREQERLRLRLQLPILEIAHTLMLKGDVGGMVGQFLEVVARELRVDRALLLLVDEPRGELAIAGSVGLPDGEAQQVRFPLEEGSAGRALLAREPLVVSGQASLGATLGAFLGTDVAGTVFVPLRTPRKRIGVLWLGRLTGRSLYTSSGLNLLAIIGGQIATALDNARLYETIARGKREWEITFDTIADGVSIHDTGFRIVRANRALAERLGTIPQALIGRYCYEALHGLDAPPDWCPCRKARVSGNLEETEREDPHLKGTFQIVAYPLGKEPGLVQGTVHVLRDISAHKRLESELIQTEKLAAMGRLVASLAHEVNNPLQALRSGFRLLLTRQVDEEKRRQYLEVADREVERLIAVVERVLGFYRPSSEQPEPADLSQLLEETLVLVGKQLEQSRVVVHRRFANGLPAVEAVADQLRQVFLNLILNAQQAMPEGGELAVETAWRKREKEVSIAFRDTGVGIPQSEISLLFEPFHTTRPGGSGLGLAISYGIVERHGGRIEVESEVEKGSVFTIFLPAERKEEPLPTRGRGRRGGRP